MFNPQFLEFAEENNLQYKEHYTYIMLTLNTNKVIKSRTHPLIPYLKAVITYIVTNLKTKPFIFIPKNTKNPDYDPIILPGKPLIDLEGETQDRLHVHVPIHIFTNGKILLDLKAIRKVPAIVRGGWHVDAAFHVDFSLSGTKALRYLREKTPGSNLFNIQSDLVYQGE